MIQIAANGGTVEDMAAASVRCRWKALTHPARCRL